MTKFCEAMNESCVTEAEFLFRIDSKSWQDSLAAIRILFTQRFFTITDFVVRYIIDHRSGR